MSQINIISAIIASLCSNLLVQANHFPCCLRPAFILNGSKWNFISVDWNKERLCDCSSFTESLKLVISSIVSNLPSNEIHPHERWYKKGSSIFFCGFLAQLSLQDFHSAAPLQFLLSKLSSHNEAIPYYKLRRSHCVFNFQVSAHPGDLTPLIVRVSTLKSLLDRSTSE